jgi:O-antigen/teichoic acid export membrane protein
VAGTVLIYFIPILVFVLLASKTPDFGLSFSWKDFSRAEYKDIVGFTWYHFLFTASSTLLSSMDMLAIPLYDHRGFASVAIYRVGVFFVSFVYLPLKAMVMVSFVVLARAFNDDDMATAKDIFNRSSLNIFIATVFVAAALCSNLTNILAIINNDIRRSFRYSLSFLSAPW